MITIDCLTLVLSSSLCQAPPAAVPAPAAPAPAAAPADRLPESAAPVSDSRGEAGIPTLVAPDARPDLIIKGLVFAEGPAADAFGQVFYCDFSAGNVYRIVPAPRGFEAQRLFTDSLGCVGLCFARSGRLYSTQFHSGRIVEIQLLSDGTGRTKGLVESVAGEPRPCVNDLVTDAHGGIWFTNTGDPRRANRRGIYYTNEQGAEPIQLQPAVQRPNGIELSPDGRTLYVVDYGAPTVWSFPVEGPGKLGEGRPFARLGVVGDPAKVRGGDGVAVDVLGNVWVAVPMASAVVVFDPQGRPLGRVMLPEYPSNCAFGGPDGRSLFITARTGVYLLPTLVQGHWTARGGTPAVQVPPQEAVPVPPPPAPPAK